MPKDSRNSTPGVAATSGFQELQGCSDSSRQNPEQVVLVMQEAVSTFTESSRGAAAASWPLLSVSSAVLRLLASLYACLFRALCAPNFLVVL